MLLLKNFIQSSMSIIPIIADRSLLRIDIIKCKAYNAAI